MDSVIVESRASSRIKAAKVQSIFEFLKEQIALTQEYGKARTSRNYSAAYNSFWKFRVGEDLLFDDLTPSLIVEYEGVFGFD